MPPNGIPLPPELFVQVCTYLRTSDLIAASQVCHALRSTILGCTQLWAELDGIDLTRGWAVRRVEQVLARAKGRLRSLELSFPEDRKWMARFAADDEQIEYMGYRTADFLEAVDQSGSGPHLRTLKVDLRSLFDHKNRLDPLLEHIVMFCESVATQLTHLTLTTRMRRFPSGRCWFEILLHIKELVMSTRAWPEANNEEEDDEADYPEVLLLTPAGGVRPADEPVTLERWTLAGGILGERFFRPMPRLTSLKLLDTPVARLSLLLEACAASLEELWLVGTDMIDFGPPESTAERLITLPKLRSTYIGHGNARLWLRSRDCAQAFVIDTPALEEVSWGRKPVFDPSTCAPGRDTYRPYDNFRAKLLHHVAASCPQLRRVDVAGVSAESLRLVCALAVTGAGVREVILGEHASEEGLELVLRELPRIELVSFEHGCVGFGALVRVVLALRESDAWAARTAPLTLRLARPHEPGKYPPRAVTDDAVAPHLERVLSAHPRRATLREVVASIRKALSPDDRAPAGGGSLAKGRQVAGPRTRARVDPLWRLAALRAKLLDEVGQDWGWEKSSEALQGWLETKEEEVARAWLEVQEDIVLECEEGDGLVAAGSGDGSS